MAKYKIEMQDLLKITNALADESRLKILFALKHGGELCVCQVTEFLKLAPSTVSKHLWILKQAGLIESRKTERWVYYRLANNSDSPLVKSAINWILEEIERTEVSTKLQQQIKEVLKQDVKNLCKKQLKNQKCSSSAQGIRAEVTSQKVY